MGIGLSGPDAYQRDSIEVHPGIDPALRFQHHATARDNKTYLLEQRGLYLYDKGSIKVISIDSSMKVADNAELVIFNDSLLVSHSREGDLILFNINDRSISRVGMQITDLFYGFFTR